MRDKIIEHIKLAILTLSAMIGTLCASADARHVDQAGSVSCHSTR